MKIKPRKKGSAVYSPTTNKKSFTWKWSRRNILLLVLLLLYIAIILVSQNHIRSREQFRFDEIGTSQFGEFIPLYGAQMYYEHYPAEITDKGLTFVLLHGFGANLATWSNQVEILTSMGDVYAVDLLGFGYSQHLNGNPIGVEDQAEKVLDFMQRKDLEDVIMIGHSYGGGVAQRIVINDDEKIVSGLVLVGSVDVYGSQRNTWLSFLNSPLFQQIPFAYVINQGFVESALKASVADDQLVTLDMISKYYRGFAVQGATANLIQHSYSANPSRKDKLAEIDLPVLIVYGDQDKIIPDDEQQHVQMIEPHTLIEMNGIGHIPHEEDPQEFNNQLYNWLIDQFVGEIRLGGQ